MKYLIMSAALVMAVPLGRRINRRRRRITGIMQRPRHHGSADRLNAEELAGGRKLLVHYYGGTSSIAEYRTWRDCNFVRARLVGNHPYDIEATHLDDEVKAAECVQ
jgi:hypothetical protein